MAISMLKIRRPLGRLIFNMGIVIPGKTVFLIETAPSGVFYAQPDTFMRQLVRHTFQHIDIYWISAPDWFYVVYIIDGRDKN